MDELQLVLRPIFVDVWDQFSTFLQNVKFELNTANLITSFSIDAVFFRIDKLKLKGCFLISVAQNRATATILTVQMVHKAEAVRQ